jgi:ATP-dependent Clp protease ATP-binding subunit ClpC
MLDRPDALVRIDMSEYAEKHNVSRLIGSPPGYVGYGEGGQLTEVVRRQPHSVVLLDEIEKAHPDVFNVMLQMFDEGHLTDGLGRKVDFRNTIIIMTSNVGSRAIAAKAPAVGYATTATAARQALSRETEYRGALESTFAPEFINRIDDIVVFNTLELEDIARVIDLELGALIARAEGLGYTIEISETARHELVALGYEPEYGVRSLKRAVLDHIEEPLAQMIVSGEIHPGEAIDIDYTGEAIELAVSRIAHPA